MDGHIVHGGIGMARGSLARIGKGVLAYVWDGQLWVTQVLPGTSLPHVLYDRSQERGGGLEAARRQLSRLW